MSCIHCAVTDRASTTASCSTAGRGASLRRRLRADRRPGLFGHHAAPAPRRVDPAGRVGSAAAGLPGRYDKMIGLDLADLAVDGCTTKAPCGGECAGRSPVDRGKGGMKRSQLSDGAGVPMATVSAPANTVDHQLLGQTLDALKDFSPLPVDPTVHLDAGYDHRPCREALDERGLLGQIAHRGEPAPIQVGKRWVVERTNSWLNDFGRLRRWTERRQACVDAYLALAAAIVTVRALCRAAWRRYRWDTRPRSPRIR